LSKFVVISLIAALCNTPAASHATSTKVTLSAKPTAIAGATIKVTAHVTPNKSGVAVTLLSGTKGVRKTETNSQGTAVFSLELAKDTKLAARITTTPSIRSNTVPITVFHRTKLLVDWPTYAISCSNEGIDAYISPAMAGRNVVMQFQSNGEWVTEDSDTSDGGGYVHLMLTDNSNSEPTGTTMLANERIVVEAKGRYLAVSATHSLEYEGCSTTTGEIINAYYSGTETVGTPETYTWELTNTDPLLWTGHDATMRIDICSADTETCDVADQNMTSVYQDITTVTGNTSGTFSWTPAISGNYLIRISLWDNSQMLPYVSTAYAIAN